MSTFAERLKFAIGKAGMNQTGLSEKTGISKASVSQYLSGRNTPGVDKIKILADATGVDFDFLMGNEVPSKPDAPATLKKISIRDAARCMGKSEQFVRVGIQRGILPFGCAVQVSGETWSYYISPAGFRDFVGVEHFNAFFGLVPKQDLAAAAIPQT